MSAIIVCFLLLAASGAEFDRVAAETLLAAVEQWQSDVAFRSTFQLREGYARTVDAALRGEMDPGIRILEGKGVCHKLGRKIRYSVDFGGPFRIGEKTVTRVTFDAVTDRRLDIAYHPLARKPGINLKGTASVVARTPERDGSELFGKESRYCISPLKPLRSAALAPFLLPFVVGVSRVDEGHVEIVTRMKKPNGTEIKREVLFWTEPSPPVVEKIVLDTASPNGRRTQAIVQVSDFRECPGGMVARHIVHAYAYPGSDRPVHVCVWHSADLGAVPPTDEDFVIEVPPDTVVMGIREDSPLANTRKLDVSKFEVADLLVPERRPSSSAVEKELRSSSPRLKFVFLIAGIGLMLLLLLVVRRYASVHS